jgi:hypothetical protein
MATTDIEAYQKYPGLRHWFNKLWLAEELGYYCGPAGIAPKTSAAYVIRPVMNIVGMSAGARIKWIHADDATVVPPGYFWCEEFQGRQISVDYQWEGKWVPVSGWEASVDADNLYKFKKWTRIHDLPPLTSLFFEEPADHNITRINVEFIGDKVIEVHLRHSPDPQYDELIPIWQNEQEIVEHFKELGYIYIESFDDADGFIERPRLGFMAKNNTGE